MHCRVRYSQLLGLHEQLRKEYGANVLPAFPPKKLFSLTPAEVEQRREQLEKYMQAGECTDELQAVLRTTGKGFNQVLCQVPHLNG